MAADLPPNVHLSTHPCLRAKLSQLRSHRTNARETKLLIHEVATIVACEALAQSLEVVPDGADRSPLGYDFTSETVLPSHICLVPILRSGLGMVDALQSILPLSVPVHHLGLFRESSGLGVVEYYNKLPDHKPPSSGSALTPPSPHDPPNTSGPAHLAIIVDPVIATGATACAAIDTLRDWGVQKIIMLSVLGSAAGLRKAATQWGYDEAEAGAEARVQVWVGGMDRDLDGNGMIMPGLGDVGDRLFLTGGRH
ncbi:MAG: hypothetical protein M1821_000103 [Bathelium mastoideum]|nr:MAG: hypothetical protein M1821_000103 [Bathelium mastoideum]